MKLFIRWLKNKNLMRKWKFKYLEILRKRPVLPTELAESKTQPLSASPSAFEIYARAHFLAVSRRIRNVPFIRVACRRPADYSARTSAGVEPATFEKRAGRADTPTTALTAPQLIFATVRLLMLQLVFQWLICLSAACSFPLLLWLFISYFLE